MAILSNTPTLGYIYIKDMIITYNNIPYQIQNTYTCKPYIYWDYNDPYKLIFSNTVIKAMAGRFYICFNDKGNPTLVPQTEIDVNFSENASRDLISEKILGIQQIIDDGVVDEERFTTIEQSIEGVKQTVGEVQKNVEGNTQSISILQQTSESISAEVSALDRKFNEDLEAKELRDNISKALLSLQSTLGLFSSDMNTYMEDNRLADVEKEEITAYIDKIGTVKLETNVYLDTIISALRANGQIDQSNTLETQRDLLNTSVDNLITNINNACVDEKFTNAEMLAIISYFSNVNSKITETKNLVDEYIFLGVGGDLIEEIGRITVQQNQISLSVSRTESSLKNSLNLAKASIQGIIDSNNTALTSFKNCISVIIEDRNILQEEKDSLQIRIDAMNEAVAHITAKKDELIANTLIGDTEKDDLIYTYNGFIFKYEEMLQTVNDAINSGSVDDVEIININKDLNEYYNLLNEIHSSMCKASDSIEANTISKEIEDAKDEVREEISGLDEKINDLIIDSNEAVLSGLIDKQEKESILQNLEVLSREKLDIDNRFNEWYSSSYLYGALKQSYKQTYDNYVEKYNALESLSRTIADKSNLVTDSERQQIENATNNLKVALNNFFKESENVINAITSNEMNYIKSNLSKDFEDVNNALNNLNNQLNNTFKDGLITEMELKSIETILLQIDKEFYDIDKTYEELYNNANLILNEPKMWIGYIPYDAMGNEGINSLDQIGVGITMREIQFGLNVGTIRELDLQKIEKLSIGIVPESCYICCIFPKYSRYVITVDNGIEEKDLFTMNHGDYPINGLDLNSQIEGTDYLVSGFLTHMEGERFLYVD